MLAATGGAGPARPDTSAVPVRVVRRFPVLEVRAPLHDLRSSESVQRVGERALRTLPIDDLAGAVALQAGVVAQAQELHVRGGRAGETTQLLAGMSLAEPLRGALMDVPLLALRDAELISGAPEAQYAAGLAGALVLHTVEPTARPAGAWRWQTDGGQGTRFDHASARVSAPPPVFGLGAVAAADGLFDDTALPAARSRSTHDLAGVPLGWRAENHLLAFLELAPLSQPQRYSAQVLASRVVHAPYDPAWTLDGFVLVPVSPKDAPIFSPVALPGYARYRAADHLAITDDRRLASLLSVSTPGTERRATLSLGWLATRAVTATGGARGAAAGIERPRYGNPEDADVFHVLWGDYPLERESGSNTWTLRADAQSLARDGGALRAGLGATYEEVWLREVDWFPIGWSQYGEPLTVPFDTLRAYHVRAPGGFAYAQGRWLTGGMVLNAGLRAEYFTAGAQGAHQSLPGTGRGTVTFSPRLGLAYPISVRDVFSLAYERLQQAPVRDVLYDLRTTATNRAPLGNPALVPATLISYEAAVKHAFGSHWALQGAVFYRDVFGAVGTRDFAVPHGATNLQYTGVDEGQAAGVEWSLLGDANERGHWELHYTWMQAWGNESRSEGDPYGNVRDARSTLLTDAPLSWDRRHTFVAMGAWRWPGGWAASWSTSVLSPLPWTPKSLAGVAVDPGLVNSRRLGWTGTTNAGVQWTPRHVRGLTLGFDVRNLFDRRDELAATVEGYPNPVVNTLVDEYGAYRTETGLAGGAYWSPTTAAGPGHWVAVHDARLYAPPRSVRASVGTRW